MIVLQEIDKDGSTRRTAHRGTSALRDRVRTAGKDLDRAHPAAERDIRGHYSTTAWILLLHAPTGAGVESRPPPHRIGRTEMVRETITWQISS